MVLSFKTREKIKATILSEVSTGRRQERVERQASSQKKKKEKKKVYNVECATRPLFQCAQTAADSWKPAREQSLGNKLGDIGETLTKTNTNRGCGWQQ